MIFVFAAAWACDVGQILDENGCTDLCLNKYYNAQTSACEDFSACQSWEYLNLTTNTCVNTCSNGYYLNGTCTCYAGFKLSKSSCVYSDSSTETKDYLLGLDWFIWGLIIILSLNLCYLLTCYIRYRRKKSHLLKLTQI